jgi:hypothetical protein
MGQYFKPAILAKNKKTVSAFLYSWDYNNGLKLMEHSWIGNNFVRAFESLIHKNPQIVVWAGDYAAPCKSRKSNVYRRCLDKVRQRPANNLTDSDCRFVVNHTKKEFVDTSKVIPVDSAWASDEERIHPLPLLTCEGNGQGGGDYFGKADRHLVGTWARNLISVEPEAPENYKELIVSFNE